MDLDLAPSTAMISIRGSTFRYPLTDLSEGEQSQTLPSIRAVVRLQQVAMAQSNIYADPLLSSGWRNTYVLLVQAKRSLSLASASIPASSPNLRDCR